MTENITDPSENLEQIMEDEQILTEVVLNERVITHPKLGDILFTMPTLEKQQRIDRIVRGKKKLLMREKIEVEDENDPTKTILVPAFQSKAVLEKEYEELGWWGPEQSQALKDLEQEMLTLVASLELLGFDTYEVLLEDFQRIRVELTKHFVELEDDKVTADEFKEVIDRVALPGQTISAVDFDFLKDHAGGTVVDDWLEELQTVIHKFDSYLNLIDTQQAYVEAQKDYLSLFSDSWQEQLQYYARLAQVFYCTEKVSNGKRLWENIPALERTDDQALVEWTLTELTAFWQGLTDEARERLGKYSFMSRRSEEKPSTEDSPVPPPSNEDGEPQEKQPESSLEVSDTPVV